jgi:hypothetical protein
VLEVCLDLGPSASQDLHNVRRVLTAVADRGVCGPADAWAVIRRLEAPWLVPMPLVNGQGDFGTMYHAGASPAFVECRLTHAGEVAVRSARDLLPPMPVGLINGDLHAVLGVDFDLWRDDDSEAHPLMARPGFTPERLGAALERLLHEPAVADDELLDLAGAPWLGPFEPPVVSFDELVTTGRQTLTLTPRSGLEEDGWSHARGRLTLHLGAPLAQVLRDWVRGAVSDASSAAAVADQLRDLVGRDR